MNFIYSHTVLIEIEKVGRIKSSKDLQYKYSKIFYDSCSSGFLLSYFETPDNLKNTIDEWFDTYEELEEYFKKHNLQVEWIDDNK